MINQLLNDLFGPSIDSFKKLKYDLHILREQNRILKRMKKILIAKSYIVDEAEINYKNNNTIAYIDYKESFYKLDIAYKHLEKELETLEKGRDKLKWNKKY